MFVCEGSDMGYILIVILFGSIRGSSGGQVPSVSMQRFENAKACQVASVKIKELSPVEAAVVCVPEGSKP